MNKDVKEFLVEMVKSIPANIAAFCAAYVAGLPLYMLFNIVVGVFKWSVKFAAL